MADSLETLGLVLGMIGHVETQRVKARERIADALYDIRICSDAFNYDARGIPNWHDPGISAQVLWKANMAGSLSSYRVRNALWEVLTVEGGDPWDPELPLCRVDKKD